MKIISKPVEMIAKFRPNGDVTPARFQYDGKLIDVKQVVTVLEALVASTLATKLKAPIGMKTVQHRLP